MGLDIVGAGYGRTGTLSLKTALESLGFKRCYHMLELVRHHDDHRPLWSAARRGEAVDWDALFEGYRAAVDWPACNSWERLAAYYPQSKVILSLRDPDRWHTSVLNTIYLGSKARRGDDPEQEEIGRWIDEIIWDGVFDGRFEDKDYAIGVYLAHAERVKSAIPPERLLVFEPADGWAPLCEFLERDIPDAPFPHVNSTEEFRERARARNRRSEGARRSGADAD